MKNALVADDTKNIRKLLKTCLELEGYCVFTAENAISAREILKKEKIDIAFIDIKMPEMSGTELLKAMREEGNTIPVIIMTAFASIKNAVDCTKMGAIAYLQKPFTAIKIKSLLKEHGLDAGSENGEVRELNAVDNIGNLIEKKEYPAALEELKKAILIEPDRAILYYYFHEAYEALNEHELSKKFLAMYELLEGKSRAE